jgi:hypothetical protein
MNIFGGSSDHRLDEVEDTTFNQCFDYKYEILLPYAKGRKTIAERRTSFEPEIANKFGCYLNKKFIQKCIND